MDKRLPSVVLIDEYPLFRKAMSDVLISTGEFQVLGQTGDVKVALSLASLGPDIIVISLEAESFQALDLLKEIKYRQPNSKVVMIMNSANQSGQLMQAIRLDANGYLLRTIRVTEFVEQMRKAVSGGMAASEKITSALAERLRGDAFTIDDGRRASALTQREQDVLCCVSAGLSNHEISDQLGIREGTVKVHVKHVLKKLNFRSRVEVAVWASERGFKLGSRPSGDGE